MSDARRQDNERQFGRAAALYATSEHRGGDDLETLAAWAEAAASHAVLDVAAGAGHTGRRLAPHVRHVTVCDLSRGMLATARRLFAEAGAANAGFVLADVAGLPFADGTFDRVTCRIAAHHFVDIDAAAREIARVLRPGGLFLLVDSVSPDDAAADAFLDAVERLRDPTHVRSYRRAEWLAICARAGLAVERATVVRKTRAFEPWLERGDAAGADVVRRRFLAAPPALRAAFAIVVENGGVRSFTDDKLVLAARRT